MIFDLFKTSIYENSRIWVIWALKRKWCCSQTVIFDLSKTSITENSRIWVILAMKKKAIHWCSWKYRFTFFFMWPLISPSNSKRLSVVWGLTKNSVSLCVLKDFFTVSRYVLKISTAKYIFKVFVFSNCDLWSIANRFLWKQKICFWGLTKETLSLLSRRKFFSIDRHLL